MLVPSRTNADMSRRSRRSKPILRVKPHVMYVWKENVAAAYFDSLRVRRESLTAEVAGTLVANMACDVSEQGFPSIVTAFETLPVLVGAGDRVLPPE